MYRWLFYLLYENKNAILSLPHEVKMILMVSLAIMFGAGIMKKAYKFIKITAIITIIYFALTYFGIL